MSLNIKNPAAYRLAKAVANETGESLTEAVVRSLEERLRALQRRRGAATLLEDVARIQEAVAALPVRDPRPAEELLGYDEFGLPR